MKNKKVETEKKEGSSQKEDVFFVQANIDDLLSDIDNLKEIEELDQKIYACY